MPSSLTPDAVAHLARLARLDLGPGDADTYARQLTEIVAFAAVVQEIAPDQTIPAGPDATGAADAAWRDDAPQAPLSRDDVLAQAPGAAPATGLFRVPKVL
jgi:aspartyl-tRNA(Asn)/glutamyl-tRNA(Gln) amidotransferase subunit C